MTTYLQREIREQPEALGRFLQEEAAHVQAIAQALAQMPITHVVIAARGTSDNAATYGRYLLESFVGWPVSLAAPSLYTLYKRPPRLKDALVIGISQSGQAADVLEVLTEGRRQGAVTLAVTNTAGSPLAQAADHSILLHAGPEQSVAATKTYTAELYALAWLVASLSGVAAHFAALQALPDQVQQVLSLEETVRTRAERYRYAERLIVVGRGYNYATAFEIALKLKELTYMVVEPYSSADFRHGPIALVEPGFPVLLVAPTGVPLDDLRDLAGELRERQAELLVISDCQDLLAMAQLPLPLPAQVPEWVSPIVCTVPGQLLTAYIVLARGWSPDHPRALHKVTVTR